MSIYPNMVFKVALQTLATKKTFTVATQDEKAHYVNTQSAMYQFASIHVFSFKPFRNFSYVTILLLMRCFIKI